MNVSLGIGKDTIWPTMEIFVIHRDDRRGSNVRLILVQYLYPMFKNERQDEDQN